MGDRLFDPEALTTLAGAASLTYLVVSYTKSCVQRLFGICTELYAVFVATVILLLAQLAAGANPRNWVVYFLSAANGFLVAAAAGKMNDKAVAEYQKKLAQDSSPTKPG